LLSNAELITLVEDVVGGGVKDLNAAVVETVTVERKQARWKNPPKKYKNLRPLNVARTYYYQEN